MENISNTLTSEQKDNYLDTGCQQGVVVNENKDYGEARVFSEINEANTQEVLRILWDEIGEETYKRAIGGLIGVLKKEILQQGLYGESVCNEGDDKSAIQSCTSLFTEDCVSHRREKGDLRDMRSDKKCGCPPQGWQLSEQFSVKFNAIMSQLSYEGAQAKECVSYLWKACERTSTLQQTLTALKETRRSNVSAMECVQPQVKYRIRKLTPTEVFRLMGVDDADIDKIQAAGISNAQQYKMAGNSIVVDVLYYLFKQMFIESENNQKGQLTLF